MEKTNIRKEYLSLVFIGFLKYLVILMKNILKLNLKTEFKLELARLKLDHKSKKKEKINNFFF